MYYIEKTTCTATESESHVIKTGLREQELQAELYNLCYADYLANSKKYERGDICAEFAAFDSKGEFAPGYAISSDYIAYRLSEIDSYKKLHKQYIGQSDIASLFCIGICGKEIKCKELHYGEDGDFFARVIGAGITAPEHYELQAEFTDWVRIYDDERRTATFAGDRIRIYRAGDFGTIIEILED